MPRDRFQLLVETSIVELYPKLSLFQAGVLTSKLPTLVTVLWESEVDVKKSAEIVYRYAEYELQG